VRRGDVASNLSVVVHRYVGAVDSDGCPRCHGYATYGKQVRKPKKPATQDIFANATDKITEGQQIFRFDTFGDQAFWGDTLRLHEAIEGAALGGVGPGVSPRTALTVGLKIDVDALPSNLVADVLRGGVNLGDPAVTVALLK